MSTIMLLEGPDGNRYTAFPYFGGWVVSPFCPLTPPKDHQTSEWFKERTAGFYYGEPSVFKSLKEFTVLAASQGNHNAHSITFF